ncbi:hypothetical protein POX_g08664 [Penicillium oxalicum]|uniref:Uncharacterized protein n=1 Tax=Penicillium oxalicum (strain 114-2 / CGMCC 5302) TaxID=933388 RepID=S8AYI1_PENO1|nr:hypothetical protein POX_g08664 [Penicillium oxalicum]EPS27037.1 hypothetical protein PDE_01978 [Penicillium oxalicum 114-2]KAI2786281.1 hypothetical protein POX_g08664 [Penicillium oxalicum]
MSSSEKRLKRSKEKTESQRKEKHTHNSTHPVGWMRRHGVSNMQSGISSSAFVRNEKKGPSTPRDVVRSRR